MIKVINRLTTSLVSLDDLKAMAKIDWSEEDELIADAELTAISDIEKYLKFPITDSNVVKVVELSKGGYIGYDPDKLIVNGNAFFFQKIPVNSITEVKVVKSDYSKTTLTSSTDYIFDSIHNKLLLLNNNHLKSDGKEYLEIYFRVGWVENTVPSSVRECIKSMVTYMYDNKTKSIPLKFTRLVSQYRFYD